MAEEWRVPVEQLRGRVDTLEATFKARVIEDDKRWEANDEVHKDLYNKVDRPSWAVTVILSILSSTVVGLIVYVSTH